MIFKKETMYKKVNNQTLMYFSNWNRVSTTIDKINFQNCKFLMCFYSLSNELSNKSFVIFFYILGYWYYVEIKLVHLFYLSLCYFVLDRNVRICIILKLLN